MIVRTAFKCLVCGQVHTTRVGLGHDSYQAHRFDCRNCGTELEIGLDLDQKNASWRFRPVKDCAQVQIEDGAPIVNLDPNFLIPPDAQGQDLAFSRLEQLKTFIDAAGDKVVRPPHRYRPYRIADYANEWEQLARAWSLVRNGNEKFAAPIVKSASDEFYGNDPLSGFPDWLFRFVSYIGGAVYDRKLDAAMKSIRHLFAGNEFNRLMTHLRSKAPARGGAYLSIISRFFECGPDFFQVYPALRNGIDPVPDGIATSVAFDRTRSFYGDAYEVFASSVDVLAYLNNILQGRSFDKFSSLTLERYLALAKPSRFGPFEANGPFIALCDERDNGLRNGIQHRTIEIDRKMQIVSYRTGPDELSGATSISYFEFLSKSMHLFLQIVTILRIEFALAQFSHRRFPI